MRIPLFLERVKQIGKSRTKLQGLVLSLVRDLKRYYTVPYVRRSLTDFRNAAKLELGPRHPIVPLLRPWNADADRVKKNYEVKVYDRHLRLRPIVPNEFIASARVALRSTNFYERTAGAVFLTGRRPAEILRTGTFRPIDRNTIEFSGQVKTRGAPTAQLGPYRIPVLAPPAEIIDAIAALRAEKSFASNKVVNQRTATPLNKAIRAIFNPLKLDPNDRRDFNSRELRKAYACVAFDRRPAKARYMTALVYYSMILGHAGTQLTTTHSYFGYAVAGHERDMVNAILNADRRAVEDLKLLADLQPTEHERKLVMERAAELRRSLVRRGVPLGRVRATSSKDRTLPKEPLRIRELLRTLSLPQTRLLRYIADGHTSIAPRQRIASIANVSVTLRLLEKQSLMTVGETDGVHVSVKLTPLGKAVAKASAAAATPPAAKMARGTPRKG